jgi:hypothetical protein
VRKCECAYVCACVNDMPTHSGSGHTSSGPLILSGFFTHTHTRTHTHIFVQKQASAPLVPRFSAPVEAATTAQVTAQTPVALPHPLHASKVGRVGVCERVCVRACVCVRVLCVQSAPALTALVKVQAPASSQSPPFFMHNAFRLDRDRDSVSHKNYKCVPTKRLKASFARPPWLLLSQQLVPWFMLAMECCRNCSFNYTSPAAVHSTFFICLQRSSSQSTSRL